MRLNPFRSLPNARQVFAWGMYDLANQSFTLLVVTLFLPIYFRNVVLGPASPPGRAEAMLGQTVALASLLVVLASPLLGTIADFSGRKKVFLTWTGVGCAALTMALGLVGGSSPWLILVLYGLANVLFMFGENFLAAFLPEISTRETVGRVSAIGWTMGYVGGLVCLPLALLLPGLREQNAAGFANLFLFAGAWFLINALPTIFILREQKMRETMPPGGSYWSIGISRLLTTAKQVSDFRVLARFLVFFCVYCCGMQVIINFSGLIASSYIRDPLYLILFIIALAFLSALGSAISGLYQDRIGQRRTVQISLIVWIATSLGAVLLPAQHASWTHLGLVGAGIGVGLGLTGAASRALVGVLTPKHRTAEFFSFWGLGYKIANVIGPALYGMVHQALGPRGQQTGMLLVLTFFVVGFVGLLFVDVARGRAAAEEDERRFASRAA